MLPFVCRREEKKGKRESCGADDRPTNEKSIAAVDANLAKNLLMDQNPMTQGMTPGRRTIVEGSQEEDNNNLNHPAGNGLQDSGTNSTTTGRTVHHRRPSPSVSGTQTKLSRWFNLWCFGKCFKKRERGTPTVDHSSSWTSLDDIRSWSNFDVFRVDERTEEHSLEAVFMELLDAFKLCSSLKLDPVACRSYIRTVEANYLHNPYHNRVHATDVLQSVGVILFTDNFYKRFNKLEILAMIVAAAVHDVCHPGVNNSYHKKISSDLAQRYKDSMNERMHIDRAYAILTEASDNHMLSKLSAKNANLMRDYIHSIIISTDMARHKKLVSDFGKRFPAKNGHARMKMSAADRLLLLQMVVHCADISNPMRPLNLCTEWSRRITEENFKQGDKERSRGRDVSNGCDRRVANLEMSQKGFLEMFVMPCFQTFGRVAPSFAEMTLKIAKDNLRHWEKCIADKASTGT